MKPKKQPGAIFEGPQERGRRAFLAGVLRQPNPYQGETKRQRWDSGWIKAKLAEEQGKKSL